MSKIKILDAARTGTEPGRTQEAITDYSRLAGRVRQRWGTDKLERRPYLWYYAEMFPEHLNELGNAWLAARLAPSITDAR